MALSNTAAFLQGVPLIGTMEEEALRLLAFSAERISLRPGEVLARAGEASRGAFAVMRGRLVLEEPGLGRHDAEIGTLIGERALFTPTEWPAHIRAEDDSEVLFITRETMRRILDEFPNSAVKMRNTMAQRVAKTASELLRVRKIFLAP
jgi:CRP-like cAMP-binding protein